MGYKRKTVDEFEIQSNYGKGYECVTSEATWREAKIQVKCYRDNEPHISHRIVKKRVKIESCRFDEHERKGSSTCFKCGDKLAF